MLDIIVKIVEKNVAPVNTATLLKMLHNQVTLFHTKIGSETKGNDDDADAMVDDKNKRC
jgi:hypothetical protein